MIHPHIVSTLNQYTRLWLCGWGTWWHVYPISSLIQYIQLSDKINSKIQDYYWMGWIHQMEQQECHRLQKTKNFSQLHFLPLVSGKMRRYLDLENIWLNIIDGCKVIVWTIQAVFYLLKYRIDAIFCKWWYMALPVVLAAIILRIPLYIHESDSHYGLTHRIAYRWAQEIWLGMWSSTDIMVDHRIILTGQILSPELFHTLESIPSSVTILQKKYPQAYPIIVTPWSLWSQKIFEQLIDVIAEAWNIYIRYIVCGKLNTEYVEKFEKFANVVAYKQVTPSLMWCLYRQVKGAIVRWGATTLAECAYFQLKTIASPLIYTHDQVDNIAHYTTLYPKQFFCKYDIKLQDIQYVFW